MECKKKKNFLYKNLKWTFDHEKIKFNIKKIFKYKKKIKDF